MIEKDQFTMIYQSILTFMIKLPSLKNMIVYVNNLHKIKVDMITHKNWFNQPKFTSSKIIPIKFMSANFYSS
jgi:hypothetical protein